MTAPATYDRPRATSSIATLPLRLRFGTMLVDRGSALAGATSTWTPELRRPRRRGGGAELNASFRSSESAESAPELSSSVASAKIFPSATACSSLWNESNDA